MSELMRKEGERDLRRIHAEGGFAGAWLWTPEGGVVAIPTVYAGEITCVTVGIDRQGRAEVVCSSGLVLTYDSLEHALYVAQAAAAETTSII